MVKVVFLGIQAMYKFFLLLVFILLFPAPTQAQFASPVDLSGYAWSSNIGWISFDGPGYGVRIETNGDLSGYAWSSNIGWISFQQTTGCPGGTCRPRLNIGTSEFEGWARACAATANGDCTGGQNTNAGGWDGWISLNCINTGTCGTNNYRVSAANGAISNYAWGGDVVGWIQMNAALGITYTPPCTASVACSADSLSREFTNEWCEVTSLACSSGFSCDAGNPNSCIANLAIGSLTVTPRVVRQNSPVTISWSSVDALSCTVDQTNPGGVVSQTWSGTSGSNVVSLPIQSTTVFRLSCTDISGANNQVVASSTVNVIPQLIET